MSAKQQIPDFEAMAAEFFKGLSPQLADMAKNFFKDSFVKEGFTDSSFIPWVKRLDDQTWGHAHKILSKSESLRDSIIVAEASKDRIGIAAGAGLPYAALHNNGGTIVVKITPKMRKFYWYIYLSLTKHYSKNSRPPDHIEKWKRMALTKKNEMVIKMPKRQFIGNSQELLKQIDKTIIEKIIEAQKKVLK